MSSPFTQAFMDAWRQLAPGQSVDPKTGARRFWLAKIDLVAPSGLTLRFGSHEVHTPDGSSWQMGLTVEKIRQRVDFLGAGVSPAEASIVIANVREIATGLRVSDLLHLYRFENATVTIYQWTNLLASFTHVAQKFSGVITRPSKIDPEGVTFELLQGQTYNKQIPRVIDKSTDPDSPDVSQGLVRGGILYGDHGAPKMPAPWTTPFGNKSNQEDAGAGQGAVPLVVVDSGVGAASVKLMAADHAVMDILDRTTGHSAFIAGDNMLNPLDTTGGGITETLGGPDAYLSIADESTIAYAAIIPIDVRVAVGANTALNPRRAMDPNDPTSYATLDQGAGQGVLQLIQSSPGSFGHIESVQASIAYIGDPANTHQMRVNGFTPGVGAGGFGPAAWNALGTTPTVQLVTWPTQYYSQNWDFAGGTLQPVWDLRVDFAGGTTNKAKIIWAVLKVKYRPSRSIVTPGNVILRPVISWGGGPKFPSGGVPPIGGGGGFTFGNISRILANIAPTYLLEGQFYGHPKGYKDDGIGTWSSFANGLIERPCDIARHLLVTYGAVSPSDFELGVGVTGSFIDVRGTLRNGGPTDLKLAVRVGDRTTVQRVLQRICEQSLMCIYQDRLSGKWLSFAWRRGATIDYDRTLSRLAGDFTFIEADKATVVELRHAIRVKYFFDHFRSRALFEAFLNRDGSGQGQTLPTQHDQRLVLTAGVNDAVDFVTGGITYAANLGGAPTTCTGIELAQRFRIAMRTVTGATHLDVGYGFSIKTGYNDKLDFDAGGITYVATLREADYTGEGLAAEVCRAIMAVPGHGLTFTGFYDHPSNTFTFNASGTFAIDGTAGAANYAQSAVHVMNDFSHGAPASTWTSLIRRYGERIWFAARVANSFNILWGSGVNAATNAAYVAGTERIDSGVTPDNPMALSRGDRERKVAADEDAYQPHEELQLDGEWIRDENTAVQLRNRRWDLGETPPPMLRFGSFRVPDMRPMQVFAVSNDVDALVPFPRFGSDGSWAGKTMLALEVEEFPDFHTEVLAVEIPSAN